MINSYFNNVKFKNKCAYLVFLGVFLNPAYTAIPAMTDIKYSFKNKDLPSGFSFLQTASKDDDEQGGWVVLASNGVPFYENIQLTLTMTEDDDSQWDSLYTAYNNSDNKGISNAHIVLNGSENSYLDAVIGAYSTNGAIRDVSVKVNDAGVSRVTGAYSTNGDIRDISIMLDTEYVGSVIGAYSTKGAIKDVSVVANVDNINYLFVAEIGGVNNLVENASMLIKKGSIYEASILVIDEELERPKGADIYHKHILTNATADIRGGEIEILSFIKDDRYHADIKDNRYEYFINGAQILMSGGEIGELTVNKDRNYASILHINDMVLDISGGVLKKSLYLVNHPADDLYQAGTVKDLRINISGGDFRGEDIFGIKKEGDIWFNAEKSKYTIYDEVTINIDNAKNKIIFDEDKLNIYGVHWDGSFNPNYVDEEIFRRNVIEQHTKSFVFLQNIDLQNSREEDINFHFGAYYFDGELDDAEMDEGAEGQINEFSKYASNIETILGLNNVIAENITLAATTANHDVGSARTEIKYDINNKIEIEKSKINSTVKGTEFKLGLFDNSETPDPDLEKNVYQFKNDIRIKDSDVSTGVMANNILFSIGNNITWNITTDNKILILSDDEKPNLPAKIIGDEIKMETDFDKSAAWIQLNSNTEVSIFGEYESADITELHAANLTIENSGDDIPLIYPKLDLFTGNTLNLGASLLSAKSVKNFENYHFYVNDSNKEAMNDNSKSLLTITESLVNDAVIVDNQETVSMSKTGLKGISGVSDMKAGDRVILLNASAATLTGGDTTQTGIAQLFEKPESNTIDYGLLKVATVDYVFDEDGDKTITAIINKVEDKPDEVIEDEIGPIVEAKRTGLFTIKRGAELIANELGRINTTNLHAFTPFVAMQGAHYRYDTKPKITSNSFEVAVGSTYQFDQIIVGGFIEYNQDHFKIKEQTGKGNNHAFGAGLLGKYKLTEDTYLDGALRFGRIRTKYDAENLVTGSGDIVRYNTRANYLTAHVGAGYVHQMDDKNSFDTYARVIHGYVGSDNVNIDGDNIHFDAMRSTEIEIKETWKHQVNNQLSFHTALGYQYEFSNKAKASFGNRSLQTENLKGSTGLMELGLTFKPTSHSDKLTLDANIRGTVGKKRGFAAALQFKYTLE